MAQIVIATISAYDVPGAAERTLYFATQGYVSGASDSPAHTYYEPRISQPASIERACFSSNSTGGATTVGFGELILVNADGGLDYMLDYALAGRTITIKIGTIEPWQTAPTWTTLLAGTMEQAEFSWGQISVKVRDRQQDMDIALQANKYGGTNSLPAGVDGTADDLKDQTKPLVFGKVTGISPPCVNTSKLIYQMHDGALQSVDAVYDRGVALTAGATYADQATMESTAPSAGQYRVWLAGGMLRLGSSLAGTLTVSCTRGATAADRTVAQLMKAAMLKAGVSAGNISSADVTALDTACAYVCGLYVPHGSNDTAGSVLDDLANSVGAWWGVDRLGTYRMGRIVMPGGTSVTTLDSVNILSIDRITPNDPGAGVPAWSVSIGYARWYSPSDDLAGSVPAATKALMAEEFRYAKNENAATKTAYPYSPELKFDTHLTSAADAAAEASRLRTLYGSRRDMLRLTVRLDTDLVGSIDLGQVVTVQLPRYGLSVGKQFLITGIRTDMRNNIFDLTVWG